MESTPFNWSKQVALVTGAGRGIGAATARLLASRGAQVALLSRTLSEVQGVKDLIESSGGKALALVGDVSQEAEVKAAFDQISAQFGPVTILVNNAAYIEVVEFSKLGSKSWDQMMNINLRGSYLCAQAAFRQMIESKKGGAIVNISSLGGLRGTEKFKGFTAYSVSKFGIIGLTECLAAEGREYGIRVNCVAPGAVNTQMLKKAAPFLKTKTTPEDVARTIVYLCDGNEARAVSGTVLEIFSNE